MLYAQPVLASTHVDLVTKEWIPASFLDFISELEALTEAIRNNHSLPLFRGHCRREWLLDSTLARSVKTRLFNIPIEQSYSARLAQSHELHDALTNLLLLKFGTLVVPSAGLCEAEAKLGVDAWFELMKRYQQHPDEDETLFPGTNLIDWSLNSNVAIFFANHQRDGEGALFVCNATATGNTLQTMRVGEILDKIDEQIRQRKALGAPLLFHPSKQILNQRAKNQEAVYFAQMDLRADLEKIWRIHETSARTGTILVKLVLPKSTEREVDGYLNRMGIHHDFIYPDKG